MMEANFSGLSSHRLHSHGEKNISQRMFDT